MNIIVGRYWKKGIDNRPTKKKSETETYCAKFLNLPWSLLHLETQLSDSVPLFLKSNPLPLEFFLLSPQSLLLLFQLSLPYIQGSGVLFNLYCSCSKISLSLTQENMKKKLIDFLHGRPWPDPRKHKIEFESVLTCTLVSVFNFSLLIRSLWAEESWARSVASDRRSSCIWPIAVLCSRTRSSRARCT